MKVMIVGGGGREHAIAWKLSQSPSVSKLFCAPGNGGIAGLAEISPIKATDVEGQVAFAEKCGADLVFVASDDPLALGLVDRLQEAGIRAFGPSKAAAEIESSKQFAKDLMRRHGIPTADYRIFTDADEALAYISRSDSLPIVVKADGLALGKGVIIAKTREEAAGAVRAMMSGGAFGKSGRTVVIEEFMDGSELTMLAFTDGYTVCPMVSSRDHKRALDGDKGLNTGGMGAISPGADLTAEDWTFIKERIFQPTIDAMRAEGRIFKGILYFELMMTRQGPKVIEYNARFGDPEAQAVLPLLETDLLDIIDAILAGELHKLDIKWKKACSCCVVMASGGYPGSYQTGYPIEGLDRVSPDTLVFHAGTRLQDGQVVTSGGRVLGVTALGPDLDTAIGKAYDDVRRIHFQDRHFRSDIGRT